MNKWFTLFYFLIGYNCLAQSSFQRESVNIGNIGLSISNFGTIGNPLIISNPDSDPSMEYPLNSGIEHLFEGGLWIGANVNGQTAVSTGAIDASTGYSTGASGFEFSANTGNVITKKSSLTNSDYYSPTAISHQDFLCDFTDQNTIVPGTGVAIADHTLPLGAGVHLETYAWNYSYADYFVILNYTITNNSPNVWDSVWLGMWTDLVVRNVNVTTDNGAAYFSKGAGGYIDSLYTVYAFDVNGDVGYTNSYGATQFLGITWRNQFINPSNAANVIANGYPAPIVNANFWSFKTFNGTIYGAPANDVERFSKLKAGLDFSDPTVKQTIQSPSNRVQLLSAGPLISVNPGESFQYAVAMVCARQIETGGLTGPEKDTPFAQSELIEHLGWAKRTFNGEDLNANGILDAGEDLNGNGILDRYILPEPPATPHAKIIAGKNGVDIYWDNGAEKSIDPVSKKVDFEGYRIYRSQVGQDISDADIINNATLIAQWDKAGNAIGFNNGFGKITLGNPLHFDGDSITYNYIFSNQGLLNGWQYVYIITSFDEGDNNLKIPSLESSKVVNTFRVFPGTTADADGNQKPGVYPNPYSISAAWDGSTALTKKIYFYNLPPNCSISIYTTSGDIVAELQHHGDTYKGEDIQWFNNFAGSTDQRIFSGGEHAWNILSESKQTITQGIYMYAIKNSDTKEVRTGTFTVIK